MNADTDAEPFAELLKAVAEFYDASISPVRQAMYFGTLQGYDFEIVRAAFNQFMQTSESKYGFPKPIHIKEIIEGTEAEREANVWLALDDAIRKIGVWQSVIVGDPAMADAILRVWGSWVAACEFRNQNDDILWNTKRKDFVAAYRLALKNPRDEPVLLSGHCDLENRQTGRFQRRGFYGAIMVDGRVETRYLDIAQETGLPVLPLREALTLPPAHTRLALQAADRIEAGPELDGRAAMRAVEEGLARIAKSHSFPSGKSITPMTAEEEAERRRVLREQARIINAEIIHDEPDRQAGESLRAAETSTAGQSDRTSDSSGGTSEAGSGVRVCDADRSEMGGGSGVAGVQDSVRDRGRRIRKRDSRRTGHVSNPEGSARRHSSGHRHSRRRKT
jgi:hypothetical protein